MSERPLWVKNCLLVPVVIWSMPSTRVAICVTLPLIWFTFPVFGPDAPRNRTRPV